MGFYSDRLEEAIRTYYLRIKSKPVKEITAKDDVAGITYYLAFSYAIQQGDYQRLIDATVDGIPFPDEFLPILSDILTNNKLKKIDNGRPQKITESQKLTLYIDMLEQVKLHEKSKHKVFDEFAENRHEKWGSNDPQFYKRVWKECEEKKDLNIEKIEKLFIK
jgi:hypothetical protein